MAEKDLTLGEFLRNERELRGITIEQVASATKVGVRTLHALEADHYAELPAKPYIRGFVTSYCRFIGLDPKEIRSRFDSYISKRALDRPNRESGHSGYAFEKKDGDQQSRTFLLIAICSFMVVGGGAVIILKPSLKHHRASHIDRLRAAQPVKSNPGETEKAQLPLVAPSAGPSSAVDPLVGGLVSSNEKGPQKEALKTSDTTLSVSPSTPASTQSPAPAAAVPHDESTVGTASSSEGSPGDPLDSGLSLPSSDIQHKVIFKPKADAWFRYQVDDRPIRKFIVRKGKALVLRAARGIQVQVSNPDAVSFSYNGKGSTLVPASKHTRVIQGTSSLTFGQGTSGADVLGSEFFKTSQPLHDLPLAKEDSHQDSSDRASTE